MQIQIRWLLKKPPDLDPLCLKRQDISEFSRIRFKVPCKICSRHYLDLILKERRLCWYGHVEQSNGAVKTAFHIQVEGKCGPGRPKMTWKQLTERDCREWKLSAINPHDRNMWRSGVRSAVRATSQLSWRGPLMWILPLYLHINQKSDYDIGIWYTVQFLFREHT